MRFSQRLGLSPAAKLAQRDSVDDDLRNSLWNLLTLFYWRTYKAPGDGVYGRSDYVRHSNLEKLVIALWLHYFKKPLDTIEEYWEECLESIRGYFFSANWYEVYDFVEFVIRSGPGDKAETARVVCNEWLDRENSAYRFVGGEIVEITSEEEIAEVEDALENSDRFSGVRIHLESALKLLSDKVSPDYRNSIKESISAVESLAKRLSKNNSATLGEILSSLEKSKKLHPSLKRSFSALYGYTSDADGIRHALLEEPSLTKADARLMLVCCSAFINYVIEFS